MEKVYCSNCKSFCHGVSGSSMSYPIPERCNIPIVKDNYYNKKDVIKYPDPSIKNANNDCKDYQKKKSFLEKILDYFNDGDSENDYK